MKKSPSVWGNIVDAVWCSPPLLRLKAVLVIAIQSALKCLKEDFEDIVRIVPIVWMKLHPHVLVFLRVEFRFFVSIETLSMSTPWDHAQIFWQEVCIGKDQLQKCGSLPVLFRSRSVSQANTCKLSTSKEVMNLRHYYKANRICHLCRAHKSSYMKAPSSLASEHRHDLAAFLGEALRPGPSYWIV